MNQQYKLICKTENQAILSALLESNHFTINQTSKYILCEDGVECNHDYDLLIYFKKEKITELLDLLREDNKTNSKLMMGRRNGNYIPIELDNIVYFNSYGNDTYANTVYGKSYKIKYKLYKLEEDILPKQFIRINKSEIVHIKHITKIVPMFKGKFILKIDGYKQPVDISRNYIKNFKERIGM